MRRFHKILAVVATLTLLAGVLAGCGKPAAPAAPGATEQPKQKVSLTVFSHMTDPEIAALKTIGDEWAKETGNEVKVVKSTIDFQQEAMAAQSGKFDIMFGLPHDNLGTFYKANLLAEVPAGTINNADYNPVAIQAVTLGGGKLYAVPVALETYGLFYNTDKVKQVPATMEDLVKVAKTSGGFAYDISNFYYSFAFLSANGGYVFKDNNGTLDPNDIGLGNDGAIKGWDFIQKLVTVNKFMDKAIKGDIAEGLFTKKQTAFFISGPWSVEGLKKAGVPFAVAALPTLDGGTPKPFVGVQAAFVNSKSPNQAAAWELLKYMAQKTDKLYKVGNRLPVLNSVMNSDEVKNDPILSGFIASSKNGIPMPNIPETQAMWTPGGNTLQALVAGKLTPQAAGAQVVAQMKDGIAKLQK